MSLILEALRRSEAERRRGEAPDVLAPVEAPRPAPASGLPLPLRWGLAAVAAALVLGGAWWQLAPSRGADAPADGSTEVVTQTNATSGAPIAAPAPPPAASIPVTTAPAPSTPAQPPRSVAAADADAVAAGPVDATPAVPAAVAMSTPTSSTGASSGPPTATIEPPAPIQSNEFISPEATVRLAELSSEERAQLPALKVSMHMWAPDAAHRFVIIDGARLAEGDRVADATVSAILADGVTLAWRGRQIRLPIR